MLFRFRLAAFQGCLRRLEGFSRLDGMTSPPTLMGFPLTGIWEGAGFQVARVCETFKLH